MQTLEPLYAFTALVTQRSETQAARRLGRCLYVRDAFRHHMLLWIIYKLNTKSAVTIYTQMASHTEPPPAHTQTGKQKDRQVGSVERQTDR